MGQFAIGRAIRRPCCRRRTRPFSLHHAQVTRAPSCHRFARGSRRIALAIWESSGWTRFLVGAMNYTVTFLLDGDASPRSISMHPTHSGSNATRNNVGRESLETSRHKLHRLAWLHPYSEVSQARLSLLVPQKSPASLSVAQRSRDMFAPSKQL